MLNFFRLLLQLYLLVEILGLPHTQKIIRISKGINYGFNVGESNSPTVKFYDSQTQKEHYKRDINHLTHDSLKSGDLGEFCVTSFSCTYRNAECVNSKCRCPIGTQPSIWPWEKTCLIFPTFKPADIWDWNHGDFCSSNTQCGLFLDCIKGFCECRSGYYPDYTARECIKSNFYSTSDEKLIIISVVVAVFIVVVLWLLIKLKCSDQCEYPNLSSYSTATRLRTGMNNFSRLTPLYSTSNTPQLSRSFPSSSNTAPTVSSYSTINTTASLQPGTNDNPPNYFTISGTKVEDQLPSYDEAIKSTASELSAPSL